MQPANNIGCNRRAMRRRRGGAFLGFSVLLLGSLLLLQNLGVIAAMHAGRFWPIILVGLGLSSLASAAHPGRRLWGAALTAAGTLLLLTNLHYLSPHIWRYIGPSAMILWGMVLLVLGPRCRHISKLRTAQ